MRDPEVSYLDGVGARPAQNVARLDVPMNHALAASIVKGPRELDADLHHFPRRQSGAGGQYFI